jgi:hypothetical protein
MGADKGQRGVYAVLRYDGFHADTTPPEQLVTVKEIVETQELAEREVERLNALHDRSEIKYWWQFTRLYPEGESAGGRRTD